MGRKKAKSGVKVLADGVVATIAATKPVAGVIAVVIQSSIEEVIDNNKPNKKNRTYSLEKSLLEENKSEIFCNDDLPDERIELYLDKMFDELGDWRFGVKEYLLQYHYLDKCAYDIAAKIDPSDERLVLYAKRTLEIIVDECRKTRQYFDVLESVIRDVFHQFYSHYKSSVKKTLMLEDCLHRYKEYIDEIIYRNDINPHIPKIESITFVQDESLFIEYKLFVEYDCLGIFKEEVSLLFSQLMMNDKKNIKIYQKHMNDIERLLCSSQKYVDILKRLADIEKDLLEKNPEKIEEIKRVFAESNKYGLNNCFMISGYYGAGKTKLSFELAKNELRAIHIYLSLNKDLEEQLKDSLSRIFDTNSPSKRVLNDYKDIPFIFVIDNLQRGFLFGNDIFEVFRFIENYNQRNVKWLLLLQADFQYLFQDKVKIYEGMNQKIISPWDWSRELCAFVLYGWLKIDQRYKHIKTMDQMLLESMNGLPAWINEVRLRNYYTPLFIRIVLAYNDRDGLYIKPNISYPEFCKYYFGILVKHSEPIMRMVDSISEICSIKKLNEINPTTDLKSCKNVDTDRLIQHGLLESHNVKKKRKHEVAERILYGVPDIVWFYRIAECEVEKADDPSQKVKMIYNQVIESNDKRIEEKQSFIMNVCSMIVLFMEEQIKDEEDKDRCISCIKEILSSSYSQAANDILKKSDSGIRNTIISLLIKSIKEDGVSLPVFTLLRLCEDGNVSFDVIKELIEYVRGIKDSLNADEIALFLNILYSNMEYYTYQNGIKLPWYLKWVDNSRLVNSKSLGSNLASIIYQKCNNPDNLIKESVKEYLSHDTSHKASFPKSIVDYYIEYVFDHYIAEHGFKGFKYLINNHYNKSPRLSDKKQNINKAIVMAGSYFFRGANHEFDIQWEKKQKAYSARYKNMIMQYAKDKDVWKKRLAMYMIIHVGRKFEKYRISPLSDLLPVFRDLYDCEDMKAFIDDSAEDFFKSNFDQEVPEFINYVDLLN